MADEKLNTGPAENIFPEAAEPITTPEQATASEPQQEQTEPAIPKPGDVVADICAGSGTTAIAAINTERRFVCFETTPAFYAAASERISAARNET